MALDNLLTERVERSLTFTKQKYYDYGLKALKLLAYKLKKQQTKSYILALKNNQTNKIITSRSDIAQEFARYYKQLYSPDQTSPPIHNIAEHIASLKLPQVTDEQNTDLIRPISEEEVRGAVKKPKAGKCPGSDGFSGEFYKEFRDQSQS